jgi:hypothetical protein
MVSFPQLRASPAGVRIFISSNSDGNLIER